MSLTILIIKTGSTIASIKACGIDFEDWFIKGMKLIPSQVIVCNAHLGEPLPCLDTVDGIIITGSPAYVTDLADWNFVVADFCRKAANECIPILGVCYGHQLLAWAYGGVVDFTTAGREIGTVSIRLTAAAGNDALFCGLPEAYRELQVQVSHSQSVMALPPGACRLADNEHDPNQAFRIGEWIWGIQFHPEFSAEVTRAYIKERMKEITGEGLDPILLLRKVVATPTSASLLHQFVEIVTSAKSVKSQSADAQALTAIL
ncbi:MAG: glutamine amidotransferase [Gammaproteobacteria bacterium]|nr:glutamine amidotransferase [Gammaproteobacteria bacterium]